MSWYVYILRCKDNTLYTGTTNDPAGRLSAHRAGKGAKYTKGRGPLEMVRLEQWDSKTLAFQREYEIKQMSRQEKIALIGDQEPFEP